MADQDRKKMIQCGDWLEKFLNKNIELKEYYELAESGLDILKIDLALTNDEPSLGIIKIIESNNGERYFADIYEMDSFQESVPAGTDEIGISKFLRDRYNRIHQTDKTDFLIQHDSSATGKPVREAIDLLDQKIFIDVLWLFEYRLNILPSIINEIHSTPLPWNKLPKLLSHDRLHNAYGEVGYRYKKDHSEIQLIRKRMFSSYNISYSEDNSIHWMPMLSNIFFDFLENGGQDCFKFCEHCGKFTVVKRSDKKFCSAVCRTASQHQ